MHIANSRYSNGNTCNHQSHIHSFMLKSVCNCADFSNILKGKAIFEENKSENESNNILLDRSLLIGCKAIQICVIHWLQYNSLFAHKIYILSIRILTHLSLAWRNNKTKKEIHPHTHSLTHCTHFVICTNPIRKFQSFVSSVCNIPIQRKWGENSFGTLIIWQQIQSNQIQWKYQTRSNKWLWYMPVGSTQTPITAAFRDYELLIGFTAFPTTHKSIASYKLHETIASSTCNSIENAAYFRTHKSHSTNTYLYLMLRDLLFYICLDLSLAHSLTHQSNVILSIERFNGVWNVTI